MGEPAFVCEARSVSSGEPICSREATHWHTIYGDDRILICKKHSCGTCVPMDRPDSAKDSK